LDMNSPKTLFKGKFLQVELIRGKYEIVRRPPAVGALIYWCSQQKIVLVKHKRPGVEECIWEIVAGIVEQNEELVSAVEREVMEEVGLTVKSIVFLGSFYPTPGYSDEVIYLFFVEADNSELKKNDTSEELEPFALKIEDVWKLEHKDMKTLLSLYLSKDKGLLKTMNSGSF